MADHKACRRNRALASFPALTGLALVLTSTCALAQDQDVELTLPDGGVVIAGTLNSHADGVYTVSTEMGEMTVGGAGVICEGSGCPDDAQVSVPSSVPAPQADVAVTSPVAPGVNDAESEDRAVTLTSAGGAVSLDGVLTDFDGSNYTVRTAIGVMRIAAAQARCEGPGCPPDVSGIRGDMPSAPETPMLAQAPAQPMSPGDQGPAAMAMPQMPDTDSMSLGVPMDTAAQPPIEPSQSATAAADPAPVQQLEEPEALSVGTEQSETDAATTVAAPEPAPDPPTETFVLTGPDHVLAAVLGPLATTVAEAEGLSAGTPEAATAPDLPAGATEVTLAPADDSARLRLLLRPTETGTAAQELIGDGSADVMLWAVPMIDRQAEAVVAHDALVAVVAPGNGIDSLTRAQLAGILAGEITDWGELGGPEGEIRLVGLPAGHPVSALRDTLLMSSSGKKPGAPAVTVETTAALADEVASASRSIGITTLSLAGKARALPLGTPCGVATLPDATTVKTGRYPLGFSITATAAPRGEMAQAVIAALPAAIEGTTLIAPGMTPGPLDAQRQQLQREMRAVASEPSARRTISAALRNIEVSRQLPMVIGFEPGSNRLLPGAEQALEQAITHAADNGLTELFLVGHSESSGDVLKDREISRLAARRVRQAMTQADAGGQLGSTILRAVGMGALSPVACADADAALLNRRVEIWVRG